MHDGECQETVSGLVQHLPGGAVIAPQGPATNPIGFKVIRGGAWEAFELDAAPIAVRLKARVLLSGILSLVSEWCRLSIRKRSTLTNLPRRAPLRAVKPRIEVSVGRVKSRVIGGVAQLRDILFAGPGNTPTPMNVYLRSGALV